MRASDLSPEQGVVLIDRTSLPDEVFDGREPASADLDRFSAEAEAADRLSE